MTNNDHTTPGAWQEQRNRELALKRRAALVALCRTHHAATSIGTGGASICVCGAPCGSTHACSGLRDLLDAEEERDEALAQLRQAEAEREQATEKAERLASGIETLRGRLEHFVLYSRRVDDEIATLRADRDQLAKALAAAEAENLTSYEQSYAKMVESLIRAIEEVGADRDRANLQAFTAQTEIYGLQAECDRLKAALEEFAAPSHWAYTNSAAEKNRPVFLSIRSVRDIAAEALAAPASTAAPEPAPFGKCVICGHEFTENEHCYTVMGADVFGAVCYLCQEKRSQLTPAPIEEPTAPQPPGETTSRRLVLWAQKEKNDAE